jgi:histo-blood group ABO system transferase
MKVGLLIIATNKYIKFLQPLIESADKHFLFNRDVTYFIFTNLDIELVSNRKIELIKIEHREWPWMTLGRYQIFKENSELLSNMDYLYYCDADMRFVDFVGDEIISEKVATQHPGYFGRRGTPETRKESLAYISNNEEMQYFAGGFNGGSSKEFLKMSEVISENINKDYSNGIIAIWHDESHMNRYFIDNKPTKILDPSYCCVENWFDCPFGRRLLALDKNHSEVRS